MLPRGSDHEDAHKRSACLEHEALYGCVWPACWLLEHDCARARMDPNCVSVVYNDLEYINYNLGGWYGRVWAVGEAARPL